MQHALGFAGGAGGVEDEQRILGVHGLRRAVGGDVGHGLGIGQVATFLPAHRGAGTLDQHHGVDVRTLGQGLVDIGLERDALATAHALVGGDHHPAVGVEDAITQCLGREAAEYHRMDRTDAGAGQHGVGRLGDHRQVQADPVALLYPARLEHIGQAADVFVQLTIGDGLAVGGIVTFPDDGCLVTAGGEVAIDAVVGDVELTTAEPAGTPLAHIAAMDFVPGA